jgi:hypothetical protein
LTVAVVAPVGVTVYVMLLHTPDDTVAAERHVPLSDDRENPFDGADGVDLSHAADIAAAARIAAARSFTNPV